MVVAVEPQSRHSLVRASTVQRDTAFAGREQSCAALWVAAEWRVRKGHPYTEH